MLIERVEKTVKKHGMLRDGNRVIAAVSGGPDSVCLFYVLLELKKKYKFQLHVVHFNHHLREKESKKEEKFVKELLDGTTVPLSIIGLDVKGYAEKQKIGIEEAARALRYQNLLKLALKHDADTIAIGHTASDQAETVLMRIMRGSGPEGLEGIPPVRELSKNKFIIRPLIDVYREKIISYLKSRKIGYCLDSSNSKPVFLRNKVRIKLLPFIEKNFNRDIRSRLVNMADIFREENEYLSKAVDKAVESISKHEDGRISVDFKKLIRYNKSFRRRIIHRILERKATYKNIDSVIDIAEAGLTGAMVTISGFTVRKDYGQLYFIPSAEKHAVRKKIENRILFPGKTLLPEFSMEVETGITKNKPGFGKDKFTVYFDADRIDAGNLVIRSRRSGDRFLPFGADGSKKLKQYFIDQKVPSYLRDDVPILEGGKRILWVVGMRQAEEGRVTGNTKRIIKVKVRKMEKD